MWTRRRPITHERKEERLDGARLRGPGPGARRRPTLNLSLRLGKADISPVRSGHQPDELTGVEGRAAFRERIEALAVRTAPDGPAASVLLVDIDHFQAVNHSHGQAVGDQVLRATAGRLSALCPPGDGPFRVGPDQFALLLDPGSPDEAISLARTAFLAVREPLPVDGRPLQVSASVAIVVVDGHQSADQVIRHADMTVFATKAAGGRQIYVHSPELDEWATARRRQLEALAVEVEQLRSENRMLAASTLVDPATGLPNDAAFAADHSLVFARRRRAGDPYAVLLIDLDWFFDFGQNSGTGTADRALAAVARVISDTIRPGDRAYRYSDDAFAVLLPGGNGPVAVAVAERLRLGIEALAIPHPANPSGVLTATAAAVEGGFRHAEVANVLDEAAGLVLSGKQSGRNRIVWPH